MVANPPRITMDTRRIDSRRTKELGSMKEVQLAKRPPANPRHHGGDDPYRKFVMGHLVAKDLGRLLVLSDRGEDSSE